MKLPYIHKNKKKNITRKGGSVIGSGGFGCVFRPQLKCKHERIRSLSKNRITKLMKEKYAHKEYNEIAKFRDILVNIPNHSNYFLVDGFSVCAPDKLTSSDLIDFNEKCSALKKMDITSSTINSHLDNLMALNMPYGGITIDAFIEEYRSNKPKLIELNNCIVHLLHHGVIPMNKLGVFHCDLKSANILVALGQGIHPIQTRIIDWGLSTYHNGKWQNIPIVLKNRPFQYNVPFSNILFTSTFTKMYDNFLYQLEEDNNQPITYKNVKLFVISYVLKWIEERGHGHMKNIHVILTKILDKPMHLNAIDNLPFLYKKESMGMFDKSFDTSFDIIFNYLTGILLSFTKKGHFDSIHYLNAVFLKNIDVWGIVMTYIPFFEYMHDTKSNAQISCPMRSQFNKLLLCLLKYNDKPIDVEELSGLLKEFNGIFKSHTHHQYFDMNDKNKDDDYTMDSHHRYEKGMKRGKRKVYSSSSKNIIIISDNHHLSASTKKNKKTREHKAIVKTLKNIQSRSRAML